MNYILNFDIFFAILLVGMIFSAIFKKSRKYSNNFFLFLLTTGILGAVLVCLVHFGYEQVILDKIAGPLTPMFTQMGESMKFLKDPNYFGLFYLVIFMLADIILFLIIKLIIKMFTNDRRKFKKDSIYTPKHNGFTSFCVSVLKFVFVLHLVLIALVSLETTLKMNFDNSYIIKYFKLYEKPLIDFFVNRGTAFFKAVGY